MAEPKKERSGCLTALLVVAGIGVVGIIALVVAGYFLVKSERGKEFIAAFKDTTEWAMEAMRAPGTDAMREVGCEQPMVTTVGNMMSMAGGLVQAMEGKEAVDELFKDVANETLVLCNSESIGGEAPDCSVLASAYAGAVPDGPQQVIVMAENAGEELKCKGYYDRNGKRLGGVDEDFSFIPDG